MKGTKWYQTSDKEWYRLVPFLSESLGNKYTWNVYGLPCEFGQVSKKTHHSHCHRSSNFTVTETVTDLLVP